MSRNVRTIGIDEGCDQALGQMLRWKVRHLPVLDGVGSLRGVLTDRDLRHQLFDPAVQERIGRTPAMLLLKERPVRAAMSAPAICLGAMAEVGEAAELMRRHRIGSLPILDDAGRIVGILTETDVLRHLIRAQAPPEPEMEIIVSYP
jgi:acetoin utilization protein AcuB